MHGPSAPLARAEYNETHLAHLEAEVGWPVGRAAQSSGTPSIMNEFMTDDARRPDLPRRMEQANTDRRKHTAPEPGRGTTG